MSNVFIGFKQADGSFYPVLKDGIPENKRLDVTTVRDDQTAVKINLFKKDTDSLDEPEYVDTLLIENLIPHPKKEPTIHLNINLDENNILTAEISDPETGNKSDIRVSMVNLPKDELDAEPDFELTEPSLDTLTELDSAPDKFSVTEDRAVSENLSFDMPDDLNFTVPDTDEAGSKNVPEHIDTADNSGTADFDLDGFEMPDFEEKDAFASSDSEELSLNDTAPFNDDDFVPPKDNDFEDLSLDTSEESVSSPMSFDMPESDTGLNMDDEPVFNETDDTAPFSTAAAFDTSSATRDFEDSQNELKKKKIGFGRKKQTSFSRETPPLYDQDLPDDIDEACNKRKCRIAVIICIICAILCILAVIGIFLRFPWKKSRLSESQNIVTVEPPSQLQMQPPPEEPAKPEENTIVIVEKETVENREVVPEKIETVPEVKSRAVRYLIKWGDTLWDLSDTYYRNPWLYPIIARENKIKNPDLIIAGTYIMIPPR